MLVLSLQPLGEPSATGAGPEVLGMGSGPPGPGCSVLDYEASIMLQGGARCFGNYLGLIYLFQPIAPWLLDGGSRADGSQWCWILHPRLSMTPTRSKVEEFKARGMSSSP